MKSMKFIVKVKGGPGSGNWGHTGRPGMVGGSGGGRSAFSDSSINAGKYIGSRIPNTSAEGDDDYVQSHVDDLTDEFIDKFGEFDPDTFELNDYSYIDESLYDWSVDPSKGGSLALQVGASQELDNVPLSSQIVSLLPASAISEFTDHKLLARELYDNTQEYLNNAGFSSNDKVVLYRGGVSGEVTSNNRVGHTLESWTTSREKAEFFVERNRGGSVIMAEVPISDIFAMANTGLGIPSAKEVVIIGSRPHSVIVL